MPPEVPRAQTPAAPSRSIPSTLPFIAHGPGCRARRPGRLAARDLGGGGTGRGPRGRPRAARGKKKRRLGGRRAFGRRARGKGPRLPNRWWQRGRQGGPALLLLAGLALPGDVAFDQGADLGLAVAAV